MLAQIFATFGLSVFLRSLAQFLWSPNYRVIQHSVVSDGRIQLGEHLHRAAATGRGLRRDHRVPLHLLAGREDRHGAGPDGYRRRPARRPPSWASTATGCSPITWAIGAGCVGVAGALLSAYYYIQPEVGLGLRPDILRGRRAGGFREHPGAFIAGLLVGLVQVGAGVFIAPAYKFAVVLAIYLVVVLAAPPGPPGQVLSDNRRSVDYMTQRTDCRRPPVGQKPYGLRGGPKEHRNPLKLGGLAALILFRAGLIPASSPCPYQQHVAILIFIYALMAVGWNVLGGYHGQISLGNTVFFGIGAYSTGVPAQELPALSLGGHAGRNRSVGAGCHGHRIPLLPAGWPLLRHRHHRRRRDPLHRRP